MAKKNKAQEVQARITEMIEQKAADLDAISKKQAEARTQLEAAELAIKDATASMDLDAYEKATAAKRKAQTALDMYGGRYAQISQQEYISEEESDKVIDSLLSYEEELAEDFKKAIAEPLKTLAALQDAYANSVQEAEKTIRKWTADIHANYRVQGTTYANGTNRSDSPKPVRMTPYTGCSEANILANYLQKAKGLY